MRFYDVPSPDEFSNYSDYSYNSSLSFFLVIGTIILISAICIVVTIVKNQKKKKHMQQLTSDIKNESNNKTNNL